MTHTTRRKFLVATGAAAVAGCSGGGGTPARETPITSAEPADERTSAGASQSDDAATIPLAERIKPLPLSPEALRGKAQSGGPSKDGIPSIDEPSFVSAADADEFLDRGDVVFGFASDGVQKAYPQRILVWHEICNDTISDTPVSVTYCPLTGTVLGFERGGTTFGVSGRLVNNNLIMYDRATEAWWPQVLATAIPGPWNADPETRSLREFRLLWTTWEQWQAQYPETQVLSTNTGHAKNYNRDPYGAYNPPSGYYAGESTLFPPLTEDDRFHSKRVVMGTRTPDGSVAFLKESLRAQKLMDGRLSGTPVLAVFDPRFDTAYAYRNPDEASFEFENGRVVAADGENHEPDSVPLSRIHTFDAMWFAWSGFYPGTNVYE